MLGYHVNEKKAAYYLSVEDLDRMQAARNLHEGSIQEIALKLLCLKCCAHDHELQVLSLLQHLAKQASLSAILKTLLPKTN